MSETAELAFIRREMAPPEPPPSGAGLPAIWQQRLFGSFANTVLTIVGALLLVLVLWPTLRFLLWDAVWSGSDRNACLAENVGRPVGACWPFIAARFNQFMFGFYPPAQQWRVNLVYVIAIVLLVPLLVPRIPYKGLNAALFFGVFPILAGVLLVGGVRYLPYVETRYWGGFLVTLVIAFTGIVGSLPLGILLALGRRSKLPLVKGSSVAFIELWRGVPLITVLFFATYMLPLFLPGNWKIDPLVRVLVGVVLFSAAYMAEVVRGGLQAIPRGQYEAAQALGLGYWRMTGLVILPQALRLVIPGIVNSFISLFKDTTLVLIVAILDLLGQLRAAFSDPNWATPVTLFTGFAFAGLLYFTFCYGMARYAMFVERRLNADRGR